MISISRSLLIKSALPILSTEGSSIRRHNEKDEHADMSQVQMQIQKLLEIQPSQSNQMYLGLFETKNTTVQLLRLKFVRY